MTRLKRAIPDNLRTLWDAEDELIAWAEGIVASNASLVDHLDLIEAYMDCIEALRKAGDKSERFVALGGLFLRTFDAMSHCVRGALSGNYAGSAMYARDLIETQFLISYLMTEPGRPEEWLKADTKTARKKFGTAKIREALDERDRFTEKKRKAHYDLLSALGSHATPSSLELKRDGARMINAGPFKQAKLLEGCIQEAAKAAVLLGATLLDYCRSDFPEKDQMTSRLSLTLQRTREKYFNKQ